jgi:hypothetical protein
VASGIRAIFNAENRAYVAEQLNVFAISEAHRKPTGSPPEALETSNVCENAND